MPDIQSIPGIPELWGLTLGAPEVRVAVIDGPPELSHPCFAGAHLTLLETPWLPGGEVSERATEHGTWVAGVLFGQHGSEVTGLAPRCTGIIVPALTDKQVNLDPMNLARAVEAATQAGADIIHLAACQPTSSNDTDGLLKR